MVPLPRGAVVRIGRQFNGGFSESSLDRGGQAYAAKAVLHMCWPPVNGDEEPLTPMKLHWVKDHDEKYSAESGNRTYIVALFNVGAYDGDPTLTMYDDRYWSTCWSLTTLAGTVTRNPVRLFNNLSSALFAAQVAEDNARDHQRRHSDMDDRPGRHRQELDGDLTATITGRDGKSYTYRTRLHSRR